MLMSTNICSNNSTFFDKNDVVNFQWFGIALIHVHTVLNIYKYSILPDLQDYTYVTVKIENFERCEIFFKIAEDLISKKSEN